MNRIGLVIVLSLFGLADRSVAQLRVSGNEIVSGGAIATCINYPKNAADLTTASTTEDEILFTLPARGKITGLSIKHTTAFSGGTLSDMTVSITDSTGATVYTSAFNVFVAVADDVLLDSVAFKSTTFAARDVLARFTATGDDMDNVDVGAVDLHVCWLVLP